MEHIFIRMLNDAMLETIHQPISPVVKLSANTVYALGTRDRKLNESDIQLREIETLSEVEAVAGSLIEIAPVTYLGSGSYDVHWQSSSFVELNPVTLFSGIKNNSAILEHQKILHVKRIGASTSGPASTSSLNKFLRQPRITVKEVNMSSTFADVQYFAEEVDWNE